MKKRESILPKKQTKTQKKHFIVDLRTKPKQNKRKTTWALQTTRSK